ncbi:glutathione transferase [Ranunculus cassubicifolius]
MTVLKLHGSFSSMATMRVLACLYEKEVQFEFIPVDMSNQQHKSLPFLTLNPFGLVPVLEDGEMKLFESRAITTYIAHAYAGNGKQLIDFDHKKMATLGVWMEVEAHQFNPIASTLISKYMMKPKSGIVANDTDVKEMEAVAKVLDVYEDRLGQFRYLAGENFSLADLHHLPNLQHLMETLVRKLIESRPHVMAWVTEILARPSWLKVLDLKEDS